MIIGIDLGTTNSLVGVWKNGQAELITNALGNILTPSVVSIDEDGSILVGQSAKERLISHPKVTASVFKRFMGSNKTFKLGKSSHHNFNAVELSSLVLKSLKSDAENYLNETVTDAVITVPAYFNEHQRQATKNAAEIAGLNVKRLVNEPTAASMAYGLHESLDDCKFLVLDLGGGTFDVTILELFAGIMEVRASAGDNALGGEDFTKVLFDGFIQKQKEQHNTPDDFWVLHEPLLYAEAEKAKRIITDKHHAVMSLSIENINYEYHVSEEDFDNLCVKLWERFRSPIEKALRDSRNKTKELDNIVLVGGATRMHLLRSRMTRLLGRFPAINLNPDETIAVGACIQAGLIAEDKALDEVIMTDVAPFSLGVSTSLEIGKNKYKHGVFAPIIERNTIIPTSKVHNFSPMDDMQTEVNFHIYQGEARLAEDNIKLGETTVSIPKKYHGKATQVYLDVRFSYDVNGLLEIDIDLPDSEKTVNLVIQNGANQLTEDQITASKNRLENLKIHPRDQAENRSLLARAERLYTQRLGEERERLLHIISWYESVLDKQDTDEIKKATQEMKKNLSEFENDDYF